VEQLSGDAIDQAIARAQGGRQSETLVWDLVDALQAAKKDVRIKAVVLDLNDMAGGGQPTLAEFAAAIKDFRSSGKKVVAHATYYGQAQYYVAAFADEVYLDPLGFVAIDGFERYRTYYKELFEKLGVEMNLFRVGSYKSAAEVYTRKDMSPEDREESLAYLNGLWSNYRTAVAGARGLTPDDISAYVANVVPSLLAAKGDGAKIALDAKLVTGLKSSLDVERRMIELVGADSPRKSEQKVEAGESDAGESFNSTSLEDYLRIVAAEKKARGGGKPKIGVIVAAGEIVDGSQPPGSVGGESTSSLIREAWRDEDVKAIVLRVDSPGGSVLASEKIYREVRAAQKAGKPVVVSMGDLAASGGYYIAMGSDGIVAQPGTITGSIGVFGGKFSLRGLYDKIGVSKEVLKRGQHADLFSEFRPWNDEERTKVRELMTNFYREFVTKAAEGRKKKYEEIDAVAQGRVWTGKEALAHGLVDRLGGMDVAVELAKERAGIRKDQEVRLVVVPERKGLLETLLERQEEGVDTLLPADLLAVLRWARVLNDGRPAARLPFDLRVR
jgi:protease-4